MKAPPAEDRRVREAQAKAAVLTEALPYIRRWSGKTVVMKIGGETLEDESVLASFVSDVVLLKFVGMNPVVVHGGGPQISARMREVGKEPNFSSGHRVTDAETMEIVKDVLLTVINRRIVDVMRLHGARVEAVSGEDVLVARKSPPRPGRLGEPGADLGFVGEIEEVKTSVIASLIEKEAVPVIAPIGSGPDGVYNINADLAAGAVAAALSAQKIVFLTNVPGLYGDLGDEGSLVPEARVDQLDEMLAGGALSEGMIPKIQSVVSALKAGVPQAHILDGRVKHALLLEIFTDEGVGTMVTP